MPSVWPNFANRVVLVTGGSRGIGRAIVTAFAEAGARVVFTYVQKASAADELVGSLKEKGCSVSAAQSDSRVASEAAALIETIEREHGQLDVLVNNAGVARDNLIVGMEDADWDLVLATNLTGVYHCIKPTAKLMMRQRRGVIVNLSSVVATRPGRGQVNYAASKGGIEALTKALAVELAPRGIRVNGVAPGMITTEMTKEIRDLAGDQILARIPLKRYGAPEDIAAATLFLASDHAAYITGTILQVDGGMCV